ncbi:hypothetical protein EELLY_v1c07310 [Entomoplasma ellychniae]|uniref:Lipoprotein n=1 Tax=Entomoplasma ellychniae TaxID=2114 RepID=A0A8E2UEF4_9MOLU|nr:lipoprotein [Entomoplasma ellychniae]PPE05043.1 hypothetical protein EELLY_v1c07310 [Entomoplasma ellychniae]
MKKLLLILGAAGLTASTSAIVVSCKTSVIRWDKIKFSDENIYKNLIIKLKQGGIITKSQADEFFAISDSERTTDIVKLINKSITDYEYEANYNKQNDIFKIKQDETTSSDNILDNLSSTIIYNTYTSKLIKNSNGYDEEFAKNRSLNPNKIVKNDEDYKYAIYYKESSEENSGNEWLRWQFQGEFGQNESHQTPSLTLLTNNDNETNKNFIIVGSKKIQGVETTSLDQLPKVALGEEIPENTDTFKIDAEFSGFDILKYRFQNYITSEIKTTLYDQLIGMAYLNESIISTNWTNLNYVNTNARLNTSNKLVNSFQNRLNESQESNIKMIWSIQHKDTDENIAKWIARIKQEIGDTTENGNIRLQNYSLPDLKELIEKGPEGTENVSDWNIVEEGYDNFFGIKGYNGIVRNTESSVEAITSQELKISSDAQTAAKSITSPTILINNGAGFKVGEAGAKEIVLVLPLYLNDIYSGHGINITSETSTESDSSNFNEIVLPLNTWLSLSDKVINNSLITKVENVGGTEIVQDNSNNYYVKLAGEEAGKIKVNNIEVQVTPTSDISTLGVNDTIDKKASVFTNKFSSDDQSKFNEGDKIIYQVNLSRTIDPLANYRLMRDWELNANQSTYVRGLSASSKQSLLDQVSNGLISKDSEYVEEAKTVLYTKYISDGDKVLYQGLYDQISKYIKDDEDETSD